MKLSLLKMAAAGLCVLATASIPNAGATTPAAKRVLFPARLGAFERAGRTQHDADGTSVGSYYAGRLVVLGVYYYKDSLSFAQEFATCREDVKTVMPNAQLVSDTPSALRGQGRRATFSVRGDFLGDPDVKLVSELLMFPENDRFLKFRVTYRADHADRARAEVDSFVRSLSLP
jgi:hypothetical protein